MLSDISRLDIGTWFAWHADRPLVPHSHDTVTMVMAPHCGDCATAMLWQSVQFIVRRLVNYISAVTVAVVSVPTCCYSRRKITASFTDR
jgi:hypothetical protein